MTEFLGPCTTQPWPSDRYVGHNDPKNCTENATLLADKHAGHAVVKGYARHTDGRWYGHWWCLDTSRRVIDPTWHNGGTTYIGVEELTPADSLARMMEAEAWELGVDDVASAELSTRLEMFAANAASSG